MNLLIDLGNTRLKWACYHAGEFLSVGVFVVDAAGFEDDLSESWSGLSKPDSLLVTSDVDETLTDVLNLWIKRVWDVEVTIISAEANAYAVKNAYEEPGKLGSDRWASLVAVKNTVNQAAIIVDCGTAITIDAISQDGTHLGGMIFPGISAMHDALIRKTHKINPDDSNAKLFYSGKGTTVRVAGLATNTTEGISNGIYTSVVSCINEMVNTFKSKIVNDNDVVCIVTGGDAPDIQPLLAVSFEYKPNLVLEGLAYMADNA